MRTSEALGAKKNGYGSLRRERLKQPFGGMRLAKGKSSTSRRRVFVVFEGGGAKGIAHLGALAALETAAIEIQGFAGTSAGAIIAALASVGCKSNELFDCDNDQTILGTIDRRAVSKRGSGTPLPARGPKDLFGQSAWVSLLLIRCLARDFVASLVGYSILLLSFLVAALALPTPLFWCLFSLWLAPALFFSFLGWRGFASLDGLVDGIQQVLARKLHLESTSPVTFRHLHERGCVPLRIVASNVSTRSVTVFSAETTPDVSVAEAVAASACIPLVFAPRKIGQHSFYDGGLVSNLPVWVFDEERSLDRDATTVALEIVEPPSGDAAAVSGLGALISAARTALLGSSSLDKRAIGNLYAIGLKTSVGLLDFDMTRDQAVGEIVKAHDDCEIDLIYRLVRLPKIMTELCESIAGGALEMINQMREIESLPRLRRKPRVAIAMAPVGSSRSLQLAHSWGFSEDSDAGITLPIDSSFVGTAWQRNQSVYSDVDNPAWATLLSRPEDESLRRLISKKIVWSFTIAYASADFPERRIVVAIDGTKPLGISDNLRDRALLVVLGTYIRSMLDRGVPQEFYDDGF